MRGGPHGASGQPRVKPAPAARQRRRAPAPAPWPPAARNPPCAGSGKEPRRAVRPAPALRAVRLPAAGTWLRCRLTSRDRELIELQRESCETARTHTVSVQAPPRRPAARRAHKPAGRPRGEPDGARSPHLDAVLVKRPPRVRGCVQALAGPRAAGRPGRGTPVWAQPPRWFPAPLASAQTGRLRFWGQDNVFKLKEHLNRLSFPLTFICKKVAAGRDNKNELPQPGLWAETARCPSPRPPGGRPPGRGPDQTPGTGLPSCRPAGRHSASPAPSATARPPTSPTAPPRASLWPGTRGYLRPVPQSRK